MTDCILLMTALAMLPGSSLPDGRTGVRSAFWARHGLAVRVDDTVAHLDSVGSFAILPGLVFPAKGLEDARNGPVTAHPPERWRPAPEGSPRFALSWGDGTLLGLAPYAEASLEPRTGTLRLGGVLMATEESVHALLESGNALPGAAQALLWRKGRWSAPPAFASGRDTLSIPVRIGRDLASLRLGKPVLRGDAWDLGTGPHLVRWIEDGAAHGRVDTLRGRLHLRLGGRHGSLPEDSLEAPPWRIVGFGGGSEDGLREAFRKLELSESAQDRELAGKGSWSPAGGPRGRFEAAKGLFRDTALLAGARVRSARVSPSGDVVLGTLLDTLAQPFGQGLLLSGPGTRIVRGLPALGGPGRRWAEIDLRSEDFHPIDGSKDPRILPVAAAGPWSRTAPLARRVALRWGGVEVEGRLALVRSDEGVDGQVKDRFRLALQGASARLRGLTDTSGAPAEILADSLSQDLAGQECYWNQSTTGAWRQRRDPSRPWISYRFRPRLGFAGRSFYVTAESLMVSWQGSAYSPVRKGGVLVEDTGMRLRDREPARLVVPAPQESQEPDPWPGLGRFRMDSLLIGAGSGVELLGDLVPSPAWATRLGTGPLRVRLAATSDTGADGRRTVRVPARAGLAILPRNGQILSGFGTHAPVPLDSLVLSSSAGRLAFVRDWSSPVLEEPLLLGRPLSDSTKAVLRAVSWLGDSSGAPVSLREEWESLSRPLELVLPDRSVLRGLAPLAVRWTTTPTGIAATRLTAPGLVRIRAGTAHRLESDSTALLGPDGLPPGEGLSGEPAPPPLPPAGGRAALDLGGRKLSLDRVEVSWKDWARCELAGACRRIPLDSCRRWAGGQRREDSVRAQRFDAWRALPEMPATCVLPEEAQAYCAWAHGRVPTHREIHLLGQRVLDTLRRRPDKRPAGRAPFQELAPPGSVSPVPQGIYDLEGNAQEWCDDRELGDGNGGGAFSQCTRTGKAGPSGTRRRRAELQGFRCAE